MGKKIGDHKFGVAFIIAYANGDAGAVFLINYAVKRKGNRRPLIFFDTAVIMGLEIAELLILIKRIGLEVEPRGIYMRGNDFGARGNALFAEGGKNKRFAVNIIKNLLGLISMYLSAASSTLVDVRTLWMISA